MQNRARLQREGEVCLILIQKSPGQCSGLSCSRVIHRGFPSFLLINIGKTIRRLRCLGESSSRTMPAMLSHRRLVQ